jgi:hypothetical protein
VSEIHKNRDPPGQWERQAEDGGIACRGAGRWENTGFRLNLVTHMMQCIFSPCDGDAFMVLVGKCGVARNTVGGWMRVLYTEGLFWMYWG